MYSVQLVAYVFLYIHVHIISYFGFIVSVSSIRIIGYGSRVVI